MAVAFPDCLYPRCQSLSDQRSAGVNSRGSSSCRKNYHGSEILARSFVKKLSKTRGLVDSKRGLDRNKKKPAGVNPGRQDPAEPGPAEGTEGFRMIQLGSSPGSSLHIKWVGFCQQ